MSGEELSAGTPRDPDWSPDVLAELHAGALDEETAGGLRPVAEEDPRARAVLTALERTRQELAACPDVEIPGDVATRVEDALAAEPLPTGGGESPAGEANAASSGEVTSLARARGRRRGRGLVLGAGLAAAAAAVLGVLLVTQYPGPERESHQAEQPPSEDGGGTSSASEGPLALTGERVELDGKQFGEVLSSEEYVDSLLAPESLRACLRANGVTTGTPLGAEEIVFNGRRAQLLVLPTGEVGTFRLLAVGPECGPGNPATLSDTIVGD
ncbi:hypothetical protein [Actinopolyspora mortivallis]|uniref:hypothetical protein n=1 Tax=Actinopolyspora mortivallis TaxID=33906 RepID=UPI00035CDB31|nr:hypothetical protein [Actinopolyspora mortivallis]